MGNNFLAKSKAYYGVPYQEKYMKHLSSINIGARRSSVQGLKALLTEIHFIILILNVCCVTSGNRPSFPSCNMRMCPSTVNSVSQMQYFY